MSVSISKGTDLVMCSHRDLASIFVTLLCMKLFSATWCGGNTAFSTSYCMAWHMRKPILVTL